MRRPTATANAAAPAKQHPTYCFFKGRGDQGLDRLVDAWRPNFAVKGKVHLDDRRYSGESQPERSDR